MVNISSRVFNQDIGSAKKASLSHPVVITDRGRPSHVLLSYAQYQQLTAAQPKIADLIGLSTDIEFEVPKATIQLNTVDFD